MNAFFCWMAIMKTRIFLIFLFLNLSYNKHFENRIFISNLFIYRRFIWFECQALRHGIFNDFFSYFQFSTGFIWAFFCFVLMKHERMSYGSIICILIYGQIYFELVVRDPLNRSHKIYFCNENKLLNKFIRFYNVKCWIKYVICFGFEYLKLWLFSSFNSKIECVLLLNL